MAAWLPILRTMKTILVTIVSDQTIPNVLFINIKQDVVDTFLFISTKIMEERGKSKSIIEACGLKNENISIILIDQDSPFQVKKAIENWLSNQHDQTSYYVNLTGGNKTTSLVIHSLFQQKNSSFFYIPIGTKSIIQLNDAFEEKVLPITYQLNLHTYLKANGLYYDSIDKLTFTKNQAYQIFNEYKAVGFKRELFPFTLVSKLIGAELPKENAAGTWFEEYFYYRTCDELKLDGRMAAMSVQFFSELEQPTNDMEFDLVFVSDNELYVTECKVSLGKNPRKTALISLQKLNALSSNFGLTTNLFLVTLANMRLANGRFSSDLIKKCKALKINNIADVDHFSKTSFSLKNLYNSKL